MRTCMTIVMLLASFVAWTQEQSAAAPRLLQVGELPIEVESAALQRQYNALQTMQLTRLEYSVHGPVHRVAGETGLVLPPNVLNLKIGDTSDQVLQLLKDILLAEGTETLKVTRNSSSASSKRTLRFSQSIRGRPVIGGGLAIGWDPETRRISKLNAIFLPDYRDLPRTPKISATEAEQVVPKALAAEKGAAAADVEISEGTHLAYYIVPAELIAPKLVWVVEARMEGDFDDQFLVDALTGIIVGRHPLSTHLTRIVYNANDSAPNIPSGLTAQMQLSPSQIAADPFANEAHSDVATADSKLRQRLFFIPSTQFPSTIKQVVRYLYSSPNAVYQYENGIDYISYSGPTLHSNSATTPDDATFHEYAHGLAKRTFSTTGETFDNQIGALHESFSDIAATVVDVGVRGAPASATWKIAEGFWKVGVSHLRSLANPTDSRACATCQLGSGDWFPWRSMGPNAPWWNSTIVSHAYYLSIHGGLHANSAAAHIPEISVPALAFPSATAESRASQIFMVAFDDEDMHLVPTFLDLKQTAMSAALALYGTPAQTSVQKAFDAVGIGYQCSVAPNTYPSVTIVDHYCAGQFDISWPAMPGANRYIAQVTNPTQGWAFAQTITDINGTQCSIQLPARKYYRIRACNNCGCGPWSANHVLQYWVPCL